MAVGENLAGPNITEYPGTGLVTDGLYPAQHPLTGKMHRVPGARLPGGTAIANTLTLVDAQALLVALRVVSNVLYEIIGKWNNASTNSTVYVLGLRPNAYALTGWVVGTGDVVIDVAAGTWALYGAYNARPSLRKAVEYRTLAEKTASPVSLSDSSTMEELDPNSLCLGTEIYVVTDPDNVHEYKVVYDSVGSLLVYVDGNFAQSTRGKIQASIVPNPGGSMLPVGTTYRDPLAITDNAAVTAAVLDASNTWVNGDLTAFGSAALSDAGAPPATAGQASSILVGTADVANGDDFSGVDGNGGSYRYFYGRRNDGTSGWIRTIKG